MKQTGVGPDAVIAVDRVQFMKQQRLDRPAETARGFLRHFRRSVGGADIESAGQHLVRIRPGAAAEFEDFCPGRQQREKAGQPGMPGDLAPGIGLCVAAVELQRFLVHRGFPTHGNSAICSSPVASGKPNIRFMF